MTVKNDEVVIAMMMNSYTIVTVASIIKSAKEDREYHFYIISKNEEFEYQDAIKRLVASDSRFIVTFLYVGTMIDKYKNQLKIFHHLRIDTYYRFFIFEFLKDKKKVLYLDTDIIVKHDIAELYDIDIDGYYIAAARDVDMIGNASVDSVQADYILNQMGLENINDYFQAGVELFNIKKILEDFKMDDFFNVAVSKKWSWMDQDVANVMLKDKVLFLNLSWNLIVNIKFEKGSKYSDRLSIVKNAPALFNDYIESRKNPFIIHYAGYMKPWNNPFMDYGYEFWNIARNLDNYEILLRDYINISINSNSNKVSLIAKVKKNLSEIGFVGTLKKAIRFIFKKGKIK